MTRSGLLIRSLMFVACLVPFTSTRQAAASFAPGGGGPPSVPAPGSQEDDSEREEETDGKAKERVSHHRSARPVEPPRRPGRLARLHALARHSRSVPASRAISDPFRNGLGTPYRC